MPTARLLSNGDFQTNGGAMDEITIPRSKYAVQFNGSNYLSLASSSSLAFGTGDYTVECWVYLTGVQNNSYATIYGATTTGGFILGFRGTTPTSISINPYGVGDTATASFSFSLTTWYHIAVTRLSGSTKIFINGTQYGTTATDNTNYAQTVMNVGGISTQYFTGNISNVRILKGTALYTTNFLPPAAPLNAITNTVLLTCQSSTIVDNSTNAFTITNNGSATVQSSVLPTHTANRYLTDATLQASLFDEVSITNNKYGVSFNGSSQYLTLADNAVFQMGTGDFTVEAWVYLTTVNSTQRRACSYQASGSTVCWIGVSSTNKLTAELRGSGAVNDVQVYSTTTPSINTWYHLAFVRSGTTTYLFVNGVLETTTTGMNQNIASGGTPTIGAYNIGGSLGDYWSGNISNLRILKGTALYTTNFTPTAPLNPITNTVLLTCQSATIVDNSTNAFTITNTGTATVTQPALTYASKRILNDGSMVVSGVYDEITQFFPTSVDYLLVAGGGGGGNGVSSQYEAGGGGAGGFLSGTTSITQAIQYSFVIGGGGGATGNGTNSTGFGLTAIGGGAGGSYGAASGGSGGGTWQGGAGSGTAGPPRQGYDGAASFNSTGGGGGAGGAGGAPAGGVGIEWPTGSGTYYAGGGGGGYSGSPGSLGGGGYGGTSGTAGTTNTGGGGGGGISTYSTGGKAGGSGVVIVRYPNTYDDAKSTTGSPTFTNSGGYKTYKWTSSGSITF